MDYKVRLSEQRRVATEMRRSELNEKISPRPINLSQGHIIKSSLNNLDPRLEGLRLDFKLKDSSGPSFVKPETNG